MDVGIGLPNTVPGTTRDDLLRWAQSAEEAGFGMIAGSAAATSWSSSRLLAEAAGL
jgi:hypothetical protein